MKNKEFELQQAICKYISLAYPEVLFVSDTVASVKLTMGQAGRNKSIQKKSFKTPDLAIYKPIGKYHGLFLELKIESPFKKDGGLYKNEHLEGQQKSIDNLNSLGYYACFSWGFDMTRGIIDGYMGGNIDFLINGL